MSDLRQLVASMKATAFERRFDIDDPKIAALMKQGDLTALRAETDRRMAREQLGVFELLLSCMRNDDDGEVEPGWHWHLSICTAGRRATAEEIDVVAAVKTYLGAPVEPSYSTPVAMHFEWSLRPDEEKPL